MERLHAAFRRFCFPVLLVILLLLAGAALADGPHTIVLKCGGDGFVGTDKKGNQKTVTLEPAVSIETDDGETWTLDELTKLPDFEVVGAALRFSVSSFSGEELYYTLICGKTIAVPQAVRTGRNLWDVTSVVSTWLKDRKTEMKLTPVYKQHPWGMRIQQDSVSLQLTFTTSAKLSDSPWDKVSYNMLYEASLSMLEAGNTFVDHYDETACSLMDVSLPNGVPYYYAGGSEDKFLRRFFPSTTTRYYQDSHMYLCGLDCVGMTHLVYEKCGLERHPSISDLLFYGIGSSLLKNNDPMRWPAFLKPGDLIAVKHGTFHIMMYLGTLRQFGWKERDAGEAVNLLDAPLVIHCGGSPFYYERYQKYIEEMGYKNTLPPDGGVTVSVIMETNQDAPHSTDTSWGKHFGWYMIDNQPLLVFPLDDCTDMAWYGPEK